MRWFPKGEDGTAWTIKADGSGNSRKSLQNFCLQMRSPESRNEELTLRVFPYPDLVLPQIRRGLTVRYENDT